MSLLLAPIGVTADEVLAEILAEIVTSSAPASEAVDAFLARDPILAEDAVAVFMRAGMISMLNDELSKDRKRAQRRHTRPLQPGYQHLSQYLHLTLLLADADGRETPLLDFTVADWESVAAREGAVKDGAARREKVARHAMKLLLANNVERTRDLPADAIVALEGEVAEAWGG